MPKPLSDEMVLEYVNSALDRARLEIDHAKNSKGKRELVELVVRKKERAIRALQQMTEQCLRGDCVANRTRSSAERRKYLRMQVFFFHQAGERELGRLEGRAPRVVLATKAKRFRTKK